MAKYKCSTCGWEYNNKKGDPDNGINPGTEFESLNEEWKCPVCGAGKTLFLKLQDEEKPEVSNQSPSTEIEKPDSYISYFGDLERSADEMEPDFRSIFKKAVTGKEELSAMRTMKFENLLDKITFVPGQLAKKPLREDEADIDLTTIIGPKAQKPITLKLPYFVSHMSFGALSKEAKIALAKGSAQTGTMMCSGEGGMIPEEQEAAYKYVFEYSTGRFGATEAAMKKADAIEIKIGQAAKAGLGGHLPAEKVSEEIAKIRGVEPFTQLVSPANHKDINSRSDLLAKIDYLKKLTDGVPVGIKIVAGDIEADLEFALAGKPDFITIDCRGGATGTAPTHVKDNMGYPAPYAVRRARNFFDAKGVKDVTLILAGGFRTSADIAKCLAMGADAVGLATIAMIGIGCQQYRICHKGLCPMGIATQDSERRERFDIDQSAQMLANLFNVYKSELEDYIRILGKTNVVDLNMDDLTTCNFDLSQFAGIRHA